jgi:hypothetical protein
VNIFRNPALYSSIIFLLLSFVPGILYRYNRKNLVRYLPTILYYESSGFKPKAMDALEYFSEDNIDDVNKQDSKPNKIYETDKAKEVTTVNEKETTRELNKENNQEIIYNNRLNIIGINNFMEIDTNKGSDAKRYKGKQKIISYVDYKKLDAEELFYDQRTFTKFLKDNLIYSHPIISLFFKKSLTEPAFIRFIKLLFETNMQFCIGAMLFTDSYIEKRLKSQIKVNNIFNN